ncbi:MAG: glutamate--cysteine ligase [Gammaproteobacteria bacterium]|nr:glutamate--cysteine ligase [Gammaproteobacteria bacterium]
MPGSMYEQLHNNLSRIIRDRHLHLLSGSKIGLEKESLRVDRDGKISQQAHPHALGSALTNPYITTDYSEALLELITPPMQGIPSTLEFLKKIHQFVYPRLGNESLWGTSMPCAVVGDESIPIADYGESNLGMMKTVYRRGLGYRYGKMMQVIAGIHFNYSMQDGFWSYYHDVSGRALSLQDFVSDRYFALTRNLQRYGWLIYYLFGASPAVCKSFLSGQPGSLKQFDSITYYLPYATTLRMGDIGYNNKKESEIGIKACYDSVDSYIKCLARAIETPFPEYERLGVKVDGEYRQLNANILQIENEYYSTVRPKQPCAADEKPIHALGQRGVQYIELRSLDLDLFEPLGTSSTQLHFLEAFMVFCLLQHSPLINTEERQAIDNNEINTAHHGRDPALRLTRGRKKISLQAWGREILCEMQGICEALDELSHCDSYRDALRHQVELIEDPALTPSAKVLHEMRTHKEGFFEISSRYSEMHRNQLCKHPLGDQDTEHFNNVVLQSVEKQRKIEASDTVSFDEFLENYFRPSSPKKP